jgi:cell division protein FtsI (penicillin-binding protein 3)
VIRTGEAPKKRARLLYILVFGFCVIIVRLAYLQFVVTDYYDQLATSQSQRKVKMPAERGRIFDRKGRSLAESFASPSLWADPGMIKSDENFLEALQKVSTVINEEYSALLEKCQKKRRFVWLKRRLSRSEVEQVYHIIENTTGLYFSEEWSRFYSNNEMLSPVIGLVGAEHNGLMGLEQRYDKLLEGKSGTLLQIHDARGKILRQEVLLQPERGRDLHLTLDSSIQTFLYKEVLRGYEEHQPISASGIVLDPHTGEILGMVSLPSHRPGDAIATGLTGLHPRMILDTFEPGSTMKPLIYAAMLESGKGRSDEVVNCGHGKKAFGSRVLHDVHGYGDLSMEEIIVKSSNIGAAMMGLRLGNTELYKCLFSLGFGQFNHLPLVGEPRGSLRPLLKWDTFSTTSIPMGHEISVNMIQMVRAYATIANGGTVIQPCLEKAITDEQGEMIRQGGGLPMGRIFSPKTCQLVMHALRGVVERGTAKKANSELYTIVGKTGTTEKLVNGKYVKNKNIGSFIAVAPMDSPRLVCMVVMDEPKGVAFGGVVAAPVVRRVMEDSLQYLGVVPNAASLGGL